MLLKIKILILWVKVWNLSYWTPPSSPHVIPPQLQVGARTCMYEHIDTHRHRHTHTISSDFIFILSTGLQALCKNFPSCVLKTRSGFWSSLSQLSLVFYISWQKFETGCQFVFEKQLFKATKIPPISKMPSMIDSFFFFPCLFPSWLI